MGGKGKKGGEGKGKGIAYSLFNFCGPGLYGSVDTSTPDSNQIPDWFVDDPVHFVTLARFPQNSHRLVDGTTLVRTARHLTPAAEAARLGDGARKRVAVTSRSEFQCPRTQRSLVQRPVLAASPVQI